MGCQRAPGSRRIEVCQRHKRFSMALTFEAVVAYCSNILVVLVRCVLSLSRMPSPSKAGSPNADRLLYMARAAGRNMDRKQPTSVELHAVSQVCRKCHIPNFRDNSARLRRVHHQRDTCKIAMRKHSQVTRSRHARSAPPTPVTVPE